MAARKSGPLDAMVGNKIRMFRINRGMSQTALAERIGVSFQQVQKYEKGANRVGASRLSQIASVLGISVGDLFEIFPAKNRGSGVTGSPARRARCVARSQGLSAHQFTRAAGDRETGGKHRRPKAQRSKVQRSKVHDPGFSDQDFSGQGFGAQGVGGAAGHGWTRRTQKLPRANLVSPQRRYGRSRRRRGLSPSGFLPVRRWHESESALAALSRE